MIIVGDPAIPRYRTCLRPSVATSCTEQFHFSPPRWPDLSLHRTNQQKATLARSLSLSVSAAAAGALHDVPRELPFSSLVLVIRRGIIVILCSCFPRTFSFLSCHFPLREHPLPFLGASSFSPCPPSFFLPIASSDLILPNLSSAAFEDPKVFKLFLFLDSLSKPICHGATFCPLRN